MQIKYFSKVSLLYHSSTERNGMNISVSNATLYDKTHENSYKQEPVRKGNLYIVTRVLIIHKTKQHQDMCQQCEFEANFPGNLDRHINMQHKMMRII